jgi:hypothetical protein
MCGSYITHGALTQSTTPAALLKVEMLITGVSHTGKENHLALGKHSTGGQRKGHDNKKRSRKRQRM